MQRSSLACLFAAAALLLLSPTPSWSAEPGDVLPSGAKTPLATSAVDALLAEHPVLLLGEIHDDPAHHRLQAALLARMAARHGKVEVIFEMLPQRYQPRLDLAMQEAEATGGLDHSALATLGDDLDWEARGWPDWTIYRPIFAAALKAGAWLRTGGAGEGELQAARGGDIEALLSDPAFALLPARDWPASYQEAMEAEIATAHCDMIPAEALPLAVGVQRLRDARLALAVTAARARAHAAVVIAGAGHLRKDRALAWYLPEDLREEALAVAFTPANRKPDAAAPYDLLWFTPPRASVDPCAAMRG